MTNQQMKKEPRPPAYPDGLGMLMLGVCLSGGVHAAAQEAFRRPSKRRTRWSPPRGTTMLRTEHILGPGSNNLVHSGDDVADREGREKFTAAYDKAHKLEDAGNGHVTLVVGEEEWPMPIPLVHGTHGWRFDGKTGAQEILNRRIGRNELNVIEVCRAYVEAQRDFASLQPVRAYARRFESHVGKKDGLYWPVKDGENPSPLGPLIAGATAEGYSDKTLGPRRPITATIIKSSRARDRMRRAVAGLSDQRGMTGGFALIAFPATYGDSGVMSFIVNQNGIVYQKNFGPRTPDIAAHLSVYNPDASWTIVQ